MRPLPYLGSGRALALKVLDGPAHVRHPSLREAHQRRAPLRRLHLLAENRGASTKSAVASRPPASSSKAGKQA